MGCCQPLWPTESSPSLAVLKTKRIGSILILIPSESPIGIQHNHIYTFIYICRERGRGDMGCGQLLWPTEASLPPFIPTTNTIGWTLILIPCGRIRKLELNIPIFMYMYIYIYIETGSMVCSQPLWPTVFPVPGGPITQQNRVNPNPNSKWEDPKSPI